MITSFRNIFRECGVDHIVIPMIQRDYAQGRQDGGVPRIRKAFLKVLHGALTGGDAVGLDFVYGEVEVGWMTPLDGQQRLTTLYLLHWYLAARGGVFDDCEFLKRFTYETRYSARHFCEKLVSQRPPFPLNTPLSVWLTDQNWYAGGWKHDSTIQSMLVVLDDMHEIFFNTDSAFCKGAWDRLVAENDPAITFEHLSLKNMGLTDELYIKMNSRGKPLTTFEHFKANFEQTLRNVSDDAIKEFIRKADQDWSDLLWPLRDSQQGKSDNIIDKEFLRLFRFLSDIVIHRHALDVGSATFDKDVDEWAECIYGQTNNKDHGPAHEYLFKALDCFCNEFGNMKTVGEITEWFAGYFVEKGYRPGAVAIFESNVNLLGACCAEYGVMQTEKKRAFSLSKMLLLFSVLKYLKTKPRLQPKEIEQRLRTLRNLISASDNEIRLDNFPALLNETADYIRTGDISKFKEFNTRQIGEEVLKQELLSLPAILHRLEDHDLLRGCLAAFDLDADADAFSLQAQLFHEIFPENADLPIDKISGALLACGDYSRKTRDGRFQFGSPDAAKREIWRELLTKEETKGSLLKMLNEFGQAPGDTVEDRLQSIADKFLARQADVKQFNWRYYFVKYPIMRSGASGIFASAQNAMCFDLCMLHKKTVYADYGDPYLLAVIECAGVREGPDIAPIGFKGPDWSHAEKRWITLSQSGDEILSCRNSGFQLRAPSSPTELAIFNTICQRHGVGADLILRSTPVEFPDAPYDAIDRIEAAANLLKDLIAGLRSTAPMGPSGMSIATS